MNILSYNDFLNERMELINYDLYTKLVLEAYQKAPNFDKNAKKHWDALLVSSKNWYKKMLSNVEVIYAETEQYKDATDMRIRVKAEKIMYVNKEYENHQVWNDDEYRIFRAVHDYVVHCEGGSDFSLRGEMRATNLHMKIIPEMAKPALFMEIPGNVCNKIVLDTFPAQIKIAVMEGFDYSRIGYVQGHVIKNKVLL